MGLLPNTPCRMQHYRRVLMRYTAATYCHTPNDDTSGRGAYSPNTTHNPHTSNNPYHKQNTEGHGVRDDPRLPLHTPYAHRRFSQGAAEQTAWTAAYKTAETALYQTAAYNCYCYPIHSQYNSPDISNYPNNCRYMPLPYMCLLNSLNSESYT